MGREKQKLTIGFVLDDGLDRPDGVQQAVLALGTELSSRGHLVHYLVGETRRTDIDNVHVVGRNFGVRFNQNKMTTPLPASKRKIAELLKKLKLDVIHVQMPFSPVSAGKIVAAASQKTAIIGTFHILPAGRVHHGANKLLALWSKKVLTRFDSLLAVSEPAVDYVKQLYGRDAEVLSNPVNVKSFKPLKQPPRNDKVRIVFLGRLVNRKGILELIRAYNGISEQNAAKSELIICGDGDLRSKAKQTVGVNRVVRFIGFVTEKEKREFLSSADIAAFPATGGESFGIVLVEAMASAGGVVIGGNNPGYSSVLKDWPETLVDPKNTDAFSQHLDRFIENEQLRIKIAAAQHKSVSKYDVAHIADRLLIIYDKVIAVRIKNKDNASNS